MIPSIAVIGTQGRPNSIAFGLVSGRHPDLWCRAPAAFAAGGVPGRTARCARQGLCPSAAPRWSPGCLAWMRSMRKSLRRAPSEGSLGVPSPEFRPRGPTGAYARPMLPSSCSPCRLRAPGPPSPLAPATADRLSMPADVQGLPGAKAGARTQGRAARKVTRGPTGASTDRRPQLMRRAASRPAPGPATIEAPQAVQGTRRRGAQDFT